MYEFRAIFLPYCLDRQEDGRYAVLNRNYKPLGFTTREFTTYSDYPVLVTIKGLSPEKIRAISANGDADPERIYLYNDGCVPTRSAEHMQAYQNRLALLAPLMVEPA